MEALRPLEQLTHPDPRQEGFATFDPQSRTFRPVTVEDMYARVKDIRLHAGVPEDVRSHFATALNLAAYSWFCYPFNVTAQLLGYISVEYALRIRFPSVGRPPSFKKLVQRAVKEGLISDKGFSSHREPETDHYPPELVALFVPPEPDAYVKALAESIPALRNSLAHGARMLHMHGTSSVRVSAELINQLFPLPSDA